MLNEKVRTFLLEKKWLDSGKNPQYDKVMMELNVPMDSDFGEFHRFTTEISFVGIGPELWNICWFSLNTGDFASLRKFYCENRPWGVLPSNFIPCSAYAGESILLYDTISQGVYYVNEREINEMIAGNFTAQWRSFNEFLEHYFNI